ncbi:N-acetylmannosamine-6-phosphate 2-epimerase [Paenibacillus sp. 1011MAR3C5]|uniref:N-acetylmannosamine-6-phosphate 2-epimerase n=1 Tax=Paenibacillus sp. 1011MAR3C5 TaxID=1675787 RepID=UPI000E6C0A16|nr:N-acetylmannosamine-6-phosphate 2-epimerase [Paenibacillus sp. 1011MAR3C5]RJE82833.1 N-acetylmannosamine-6-phosphate 2-epimerase [Paenibacillus sp. 1011MAR3C5]
MNKDLIQALSGGLIVSCQAYAGEPLYGSDTMAKLAVAAREGGAVGIRANSPADIAAIKESLALPIIGIWKARYDDSQVYITPTYKEAIAVAEAGADIIAIDATSRRRPGGESLADIVKLLRSEYPHCLLMADVSTLDEGLQAEVMGFDIISTTLSGYTEYSPQQKEPDFNLVEELARRATIPVFAEGRIQSPEQACQCLLLGAHAVVIGSAITRPEAITKKFVDGLTQRPELVGKE